jgi:hypothetical protein
VSHYVLENSEIRVEITADEGGIRTLRIASKHTGATYGGRYQYRATLEPDGVPLCAIRTQFQRRGSSAGEVFHLWGLLTAPDGSTPLWFDHEVGLGSAGAQIEEHVTIGRSLREARSVKRLDFGLVLEGDPGHRVVEAIPFVYPSHPSPSPERNTPFLYPLSSMSDLGDEPVLAEAWAIGNAEETMLVGSYDPDRVLFSRLSATEDGCAFVGGVYGPVPGAEDIALTECAFLGPTTYTLVPGDGLAASYEYRRQMARHGHRPPEGYDPPLHWNVLYNLGWRHYSTDDLKREAGIARKLGCEALYLDPTWNKGEGSELWDDDRFGPMPDFVKMLQEEYGMTLSLHTMSSTRDRETFKGLHRLGPDGRPYERDTCYLLCQAAPAWQDRKIERLRKLCRDGARFLMFDFNRWWPEGCRDPSHGHSVPCTVWEHIAGLDRVIRAIRAEFPGVLLECHDPVVSGTAHQYCPRYLTHDLERSWHEGWAFEFMWEPLDDLLKGRSISLLDYNLAYELPLYLHINLGKDNGNTLAFWWYASLCRHMGIGGVDESHRLWPAARDAVARYLELKDYFVHGRFFADAEGVHHHVLPGKGAIAVLFNLSEDESEVAFCEDLSRFQAHPPTPPNPSALHRVSIPPLSSAIVEIGAP